ncbi:NRXN2 [Cordylochernes scorpioides]|uniref:NRXN2 n=1 Tax=Cordylochernes scorpioides TaxID=51811 RepID=A0ABY6KH98_9ARAC|nr:NRXN2 [Cordylochernes scorpioides]
MRAAKTPHLPVVFKSKYTHVALPPLKGPAPSLRLQFKTGEPNGLLAYHGDSLALELSGGHVVLTAGTRSVRSERSVNDHQWHEIAIERTTRHLLALRAPVVAPWNVAGVSSDRTIPAPGPFFLINQINPTSNAWVLVSMVKTVPQRTQINFADFFAVLTEHVLRTQVDGGKSLAVPGLMGPLQLSGLLYIGGLPRPKYDELPELKSRHGFLGCLASLEADGASLDLVADAAVPSTLVARGCPGTSSHPLSCSERC